MSKPSPRDQRFFPRRPAHPVPVLLRPADSAAEPFPGRVHDYSPSGLSIQVEQDVSAGTALAVHLADGPASPPLFRVVVEHCHAHHAQYRLGCKFDAMQHWDDLQIFG